MATEQRSDEAKYDAGFSSIGNLEWETTILALLAADHVNSGGGPLADVLGEDGLTELQDALAAMAEKAGLGPHSDVREVNAFTSDLLNHEASEFSAVARGKMPKLGRRVMRTSISSSLKEWGLHKNPRIMKVETGLNDFDDGSLALEHYQRIVDAEARAIDSLEGDIAAMKDGGADPNTDPTLQLMVENLGISRDYYREAVKDYQVAQLLVTLKHQQLILSASTPAGERPLALSDVLDGQVVKDAIAGVERGLASKEFRVLLGATTGAFAIASGAAVPMLALASARLVGTAVEFKGVREGLNGAGEIIGDVLCAIGVRPEKTAYIRRLGDGLLSLNRKVSKMVGRGLDRISGGHGKLLGRAALIAGVGGFGAAALTSSAIVPEFVPDQAPASSPPVPPSTTDAGYDGFDHFVAELGGDLRSEVPGDTHPGPVSSRDLVAPIDLPEEDTALSSSHQSAPESHPRQDTVAGTSEGSAGAWAPNSVEEMQPRAAAAMLEGQGVFVMQHQDTVYNLAEALVASKLDEFADKGIAIEDPSGQVKAQLVNHLADHILDTNGVIDATSMPVGSRLSIPSGPGYTDLVAEHYAAEGAMKVPAEQVAARVHPEPVNDIPKPFEGEDPKDAKRPIHERIKNEYFTYGA